MLDDSSESTALLQVLSCFCLQPTVDPVVAVSDDAVAEGARDLLEALLGLLARLGHTAVVCGAIGHPSLSLSARQECSRRTTSCRRRRGVQEADRQLLVAEHWR